MSLRLELLGGFQALAGQKPVGRALTARHQQILAYLAIHRHAGVPRQRLAGVLWPDSTDAQALTNLRRELHHLRQALPEIDVAIEADARSLRWRVEWRGTIDLDDFRRAAEDGLDGRRDRLEAAVRLYRGELLPDCDDSWIELERTRARDLIVRVLTRLISLLENERAFAPAIDAARRLLQIDPIDENAWRALMRCHARRGERAVALHVYHRCVAALKQHVGASPDAATQLAYREILELDDTDVVPASPSSKPIVYPLLGRKDEFGALRHAWRAADEGHARLALVRGEAGIGKTRLAEEMVVWAAANGIRAAATRCYAGEGRLAYAPITSWLQSKIAQPAIDTLDPIRLSEIARIHPDLIASRPDVAPPAPQLETWQRHAFFDALTRVFHAIAPLLLVLDDLQWCDSESLEWLHFLLRSSPGFRCLVVGTVRAEEAADNAALGVFLRDLDREERLTVVNLGPLDEAATAQLAEEAAGHELDAAARASVFHQTEGHPLHIVERARMDAADGPGGSAVPPRVQSVVVARLVQLSSEARDAAELAAVIGRDFSFEILAHASDLEEHVLVRALDELWRRQIVRAQDADRWDFSHDRIREVTYASIGPARRRLLHRRVAQALQHTAGPGLDRIAASVATHLERAGLHARAIDFFERAAAVAARVSALEEAIRCLTLGLSLLQNEPESNERSERELALRSALSGSLTAARGYAAVETEDNLERVAALERLLHGGVPVRWLWGLWTLRFVLGDLKTSRVLAEQSMTYAERDPACRCEAHHALAGTLVTMGEVEASREHFEIAISSYDEEHPQYSALGSDLGVFGHAWYAHALWLLGQPDAACVHADKAVAHATRLEHPYSCTVAHAYAALTHQLRRDVGRVHESAAALGALCDRHGFAYYREWALIFEGWAAVQDGRIDGIDQIQMGIDRLTSQRAQARRSYYLSLLAEALIIAGRNTQAIERLDEALAAAHESLDAWWLPELYRLKGEAVPPAEAEPLFRRALEIARLQGSRALERRAAASLDRTLSRTVRERSHA